MSTESGYSEYLTYVKALFDLGHEGAYTDISGITNAKYEQFTNASAHIYRQVIAIFEHFGLNYYLFAGSMVGYVRNGEMPPWMDDIDVMIFPDQIDLFENKVLSALKECGFNVFAPRKTPKGGYHILALQLSGDREEEIKFSSELKVKVPWAQVDVFFSHVDENGFIRNNDGWGQYGKKDVPYSLVEPQKRLTISGIEFPVFSKYEEYVTTEYGNVHDNIRVASHSEVFLKRENMSAATFLSDWRNFVDAEIGFLPPSVTPEKLKNHSPLAGIAYMSGEGESFDEITSAIIAHRAATVFLSDGISVHWVMDLRRIFPTLRIGVQIETKAQAAHAAHLRRFIDDVSAKSEELLCIYVRFVEKLEGYGC
ncbi:LicD family protein [Roseivivax marinus]|uniref:LicD family protein n=1 Tax=Roseivivax marinus TaxID=1379903 RepID=UPI00273DC248|nr:LicD family protein [Roseivivax marinus]